MIRNIIRFVVVLGLVCVLTGSGVAVLYAVFKGDLARREGAALLDAVDTVCPDGATVDLEKPLVGRPFAPGSEPDPDAVYAASDAAGKTVAYIAAGSAQGYSSVVHVMVGVQPETYEILRVAVLSQAETPGLGATISETKSTWTLWQKLFGSGEAERRINTFMDQFPGKKVDQFPQIHAITAATITSNAVKAAADQAVERIKKATQTKP